MTRVYKTARGKTVDMDKIKLANESSVAVGNMKVNARGDAVGAGGQVTAGRNQLMDQVYAVDPPPYSPNDPAIHNAMTARMEANKAKEAQAIVAVVEAEKTATAPASKEPSTRGSLANAISKTTKN